MQKQLKYSRQREALINLLRSVTNHPSAEWLYAQLKKDFPNISLATVYRNLALLSETGDIMKIDVGSGCEHYDGNTQNHYHFYCNSCGNIYDVEMTYVSDIDRSAEKILNADIENHNLVFNGTCAKCKSLKN